jgi:carboxyl-terminal processing protease
MMSYRSVSFISLFSLALLLAATPCLGAASARERVAALVRERAFEPPSEEALSRFAAGAGGADAINVFLQSFDTYARYVPAADFRRLAEGQRSFPAGVGMDLVLNAAKAVICIPYPGSEAEKAGIHYGDELLSVDGQDVTGADLDDVGVLVRGDAGSVVKLRVADSEGRVRTLSATRRKTRAYAVIPEGSLEGLTRARVLRFNDKTLKELEPVLSSSREGRGIVLDLRGNTGGDPDVALAAAKLFLRKDVALPGIRGRFPAKAARLGERTTADGPYAARFVYIWQDGLTASAAEVFIAALLESPRTVTIGVATAGKATVQTVFPLADGARLKLTTAVIHYPESDAGWGRQGIAPLRQVELESATPEALVNEVPLINITRAVASEKER